MPTINLPKHKVKDSIGLLSLTGREILIRDGLELPNISIYEAIKLYLINDIL